MLKRLVDVLFSLVGLIATSPLLAAVMLLVWLQDGHSPLYMAPRVGKSGRVFRMVKLRSMVVNADASGVDSTAGGDTRITPIGRFIRRYKLDELTQLWNVLVGQMSLVGPRPNVQRETDLYTQLEKGLLAVRPGITDFASIVFADEGEILMHESDPDLAYNQLIRPWKSRLGLFYIEKQSLALDLQLIWITLSALLSRQSALKAVESLLAGLGAEDLLVRVAARKSRLLPTPPPGADQVVFSRERPPA